MTKYQDLVREAVEETAELSGIEKREVENCMRWAGSEAGEIEDEDAGEEGEEPGEIVERGGKRRRGVIDLPTTSTSPRPSSLPPRPPISAYRSNSPLHHPRSTHHITPPVTRPRPAVKVVKVYGEKELAILGRRGRTADSIRAGKELKVAAAPSTRLIDGRPSPQPKLAVQLGQSRISFDTPTETPDGYSAYRALRYGSQFTPATAGPLPSPALLVQLGKRRTITDTPAKTFGNAVPAPIQPPTTSEQPLPPGLCRLNLTTTEQSPPAYDITSFVPIERIPPTSRRGKVDLTAPAVQAAISAAQATSGNVEPGLRKDTGLAARTSGMDSAGQVGMTMGRIAGDGGHGADQVFF